MKLLDLQNLVSSGYGRAGADGSMGPYYNHKTGQAKPNAKGGDGLARFVAIEIAETFDATLDEHEQLDEAIQALENAQADLGGAIRTLDWKLREALCQSKS